MSLRKKTVALLSCVLIVGGFMSSTFAAKTQIRSTQSTMERYVNPDTKLWRGVQTDTLLWFAAEDGGGSSSWNDRISGTPWDTVDFSNPTIDTIWHVDTFNACSGESAMWCGDPDVSTSGGYLDEWWQELTSPFFVIPNAADSAFLIYDQWLRCEHNDVFPWQYGYDGYQVRLAVKGSGLSEWKPWQAPDDSSYYRGGHDYGEWDSLFAMGWHGSTGGGFGWDQETGCSQKSFNFLDPYATSVNPGDTVTFKIIFASDMSYNTTDDPTLFGLILDNILAVAYTPGKGVDTLFYDDFEGSPQGWTYDRRYPTGNWWWLSFFAHTGTYGAFCGDMFTGQYPRMADNAIVSPKIAHDNLPGDLDNLWLDWWLKCDVDSNASYAYNMYKLDDGEWTHISLLTTPFKNVYGLVSIDNAQWWHNSSLWGDSLFNLTPLVTDPGITWDTLQVCVGFYSYGDDDTVYTTGLQVDDIALIGSRGKYYSLGVTAAKIPSPNANDVQLHMDTVAVANYGSNMVGSGDYIVKMTIVDSTGAAVFGPGTVISQSPTPQIDATDTVKVPLDASACEWTLIEEGSCEFLIWTECTGSNEDTYPADDTLKNDAGYFPSADNYPAGTGELRHHDQDFYSYGHNSSIWLNSNMIAAVRSAPDPGLYPFDLKWTELMIREYGYDFDLLVFGPGDETQPGTLLATVPFSTPDNHGLKRLQRIDLSAISALRDLSCEFWVGIQPHTNTQPEKVVYFEVYDPAILGEWDRSYLYDGTSWEKREWDWVFTCGISFRAVFPEAEKVGDDLHLDWDDVSQGSKYYIYRETDPEPEPTVPFDSTTVSDYTDPGVLGIGAGYYYWFHTVHQDNSVYDKLSEAVSEFGRELDNGSGF